MQAKEAEAEADSQLNQITSLTAEKAQAQMNAAKNQAVAALRLPELREEEARAAAALQRLQIAGRQLEEDAGRILKRRDELQRRLAQLAEDIRREERLAADNAGSLERLDREERGTDRASRRCRRCRHRGTGAAGRGQRKNSPKASAA